MTKITRTFLQLTDEIKEKTPQQKTKKSKTPEGPTDITVAHQQQPDSQETTSITTSQANKFSKTLDPNTFVLKNSTATSFFKWVNKRYFAENPVQPNKDSSFEDLSIKRILEEKHTTLKNNMHHFIKNHFHEVTFANQQIQLDLSQNNKADLIRVEFNSLNSECKISINEGAPLVLSVQGDLPIFYRIFDFKLDDADTFSFSEINNTESANDNTYRAKFAELQRGLNISYKNLSFQKIKDDTELAVINEIDTLTHNSSKPCLNPITNNSSLQNVFNNSLRIGANQGSATVVNTGNELKVYSASHVFRDENPPFIAYAQNDTEFTLKIEDNQTEQDTIILSFEDPEAAKQLFSGVPIATAKPTPNDFIFITGYPSDFQNSNQQQMLLSSGFALYSENPKLINSTTPSFQGSSGGGMFWYNPTSQQIERIATVSGGIQALSITPQNRYDGSIISTGFLINE